MMEKKDLKIKNTINSKKIAKNTLMLYFRHILIMLVSLYTVRVVLNTLGVEDYGIYNVVGGVVALFSFFNSTMASASQRFFSFAIGENDPILLEKTFAVNWVIYGVIAIIAFILLETIGLWFLNTKLIIPLNRYNAALWIYHLSVLSFLASILSTPFMAMIIAHEDMNIYAYVSIVEALLKLIIVYILTLISYDKLIIYGILIFASTFLTTTIYATISKKRYKECKIQLTWNPKIFKEIFSFTGWSLFGSISVVLRNQAITILLNQMFNPAIVATRTIASQVSNTVNVFSNNFNTGLYPPIIKSYASGNKKQMFNLVFHGSKITYFLMFLFTLPLFIEMPFIMEFWLNNPPKDIIIFTRLALIDSLITSVSLPLMTTVRATGKVKIYELTLGSILILSFFSSWYILYMGMPAYSVMIIAIIATFLMFLTRLLILKRLISFPTKKYIKKVIFPLVLMSSISIFISSYINFQTSSKLISSILSILCIALVVCINSYFVILNKSDRKRIKKIINNKIQHR